MNLFALNYSFAGSRQHLLSHKLLVNFPPSITIFKSFAAVVVVVQSVSLLLLLLLLLFYP